MHTYIRFSLVSLFCLSIFAVTLNQQSSIEFSGNSRQRDKCTSAVVTNNGYAVFGTNYDNTWTGGAIFYNKRDLKKSNRYMDFQDPNAEVFEWTSKFASVTFNVGLYQYAWGGMNERGLSFGTMSLREITDDPTDPRAHMASPFWCQYVLDTCETVDELMATDAQIKIDTRDHFLFSDRFGNAVVVEFENGHMVFYRGDDLDIPVLTNDPYINSCELWEQVKHTSETYGHLDGSLGRFCIAADMVDEFSQTSDQAAVNYMMSVLSASGWTQQTPSMWSIVCDTKNLRIYFNTLYDRQIRYIDLLSHDPSGKYPNKMLDVHTSKRGDLTNEFEDLDWVEVVQIARERLEREAQIIPEEVFQQLISSMKSFKWTGNKKAQGAQVANEADVTVSNLRCALNPANGRVLVTWQESDGKNSSSSQIKSAIVFPTLDGTYAVAEHHTLSEGNGYNGNPYPAYLSSRNTFIVVWDQADPTKPVDTSSIRARLVSGSGLPALESIELVGGKLRNEAPQIYERISESAHVSKKAGAKVDLVYSSAIAGKKGISNVTLNLASVDSKYKAGKPTSIIKSANGERILPAGSGVAEGQFLYLPVVDETGLNSGKAASEPEIIVIDSNDKLADRESIGNTGDTCPRVSLIADSGQTQILASSISSANRVTNYVFLGDEDTGELEFDSSAAERMSSVDVFSQAFLDVKPGTDAGVQLFAAKKGKVYQRAIGSDGTTGGGYKKFVKKAKGVDAVTGTEIYKLTSNGKAELAKSRKILVIWHTVSGKGVSEIRAEVMDIKR